MSLVARGTGVAAVVSARTCELLERRLDMARLRAQAHGDPQVSQELHEIRQVGLTAGSDHGTLLGTDAAADPPLLYLGPKDVAEQVGIGERAVVKAIQDGRLPAAKFGRLWQISRADAMAFELRRGQRSA